ncbi:CDP-diacylglycerol--glycerol-3-phosphate 3-phosphatidyltransferase [Nakamurella panacisegetis]|uniref:CDP-diacylglycerol--glycerol-3-phosphate 3-phosphatidyltransferase n=1 Tax=Nakamurella panacisegetis TaxID=1090615 RepID=A0A1H0S030_9ACTN|nr:CDP-diacylglycerol--glycerol-3-phosphate 3-phosphatidyltransferase [Nakamurella panacisegetis]SDP34985.1 CDP-diacylglycerol--glycerol-3-phosphate 3-phosphatidyltransferase [Nakamurella panacisegetis]
MAEQPRVSLVNLPNALTVLRLVLVPVFLLALFAGGGHHTSFRWLAWAIFAVAAITDRFDGHIARKRGQVTDFGKIADPMADKALTGSALIGLSMLGDLAWWVTVVILVREIGITLLRFAVIRYGVIAASPGGKAKTLVQIIAIGLYVLPLPHALHWVAMSFMIVAVILTVVTGVDYLVRAATLVSKPRNPTSNNPG